MNSAESVILVFLVQQMFKLIELVLGGDNDLCAFFFSWMDLDFPVMEGNDLLAKV